METSSSLTRRQALRWAGAASLGLWTGARSLLRAVESETIARIEPQGMLIRDCGLPGETRADDVVPAHPNGIPVSRRRWLLVYATRGFRGVDDDLSIVYQLRADAPDGRLIKEGFFSRTLKNWDPLGDGNTRHVKQHGHPVAFGVPRGAVIDGQPAPSANVFVVKWRKVARDYDPVQDFMPGSASDPEIEFRTQAVEWIQFRLNDAEDDLEILQAPRPLRQRGFETGPRFCAAPVHTINESFVQAVPYNRDRTAWADCCHFDGGRIACLKYTFNPRLGRYEWTDIGPLLGGTPGAPVVEATGGKTGLVEASLAHWRDSWIIAARGGPGGGSTWYRTDDPFGPRAPSPVNPAHPKITTPLTAYVWSDAQLRLFTGDGGISPYHNSRDPLYCWDIDPESGFRASHRRVIFDSVAARLPIRSAVSQKVDMCKLLAAQGGQQVIVYRGSIRCFNHPYPKNPQIPTASPAEKTICGIYYSRITYAEPFPDMWNFGS